MGVATDAILAFGYSMHEDFDPEDLEDRLPEGVEFVEHCSMESPLHVLSAYTFTSHRGQITEIDPVILSNAEGFARPRLKDAVEKLGLGTPNVDPTWHLVSFWEV